MGLPWVSAELLTRSAPVVQGSSLRSLFWLRLLVSARRCKWIAAVHRTTTDVIADVREIAERRWLFRDELDRRIAAQGFGIGAGFVRFIHEVLSLDFIAVRDQRVKFDRETEAAQIVFHQAHQRPHG